MSESEHREGLRGRPGRRTASEKREAVLALIAGKASVDQLAQRYGVRPETVEKWREEALGAIESSFGKSAKQSGREKDLERKLRVTQNALTEAIMSKELLQQALDRERSKRPSKPRRSRR